MKGSIATLARSGLCVAVAFCVVLWSGCAAVTEQRPEERFPSLKGTAREMGRGLINVGFCWLEIPDEVETRIRGDAPGDPFNVVAGAIDVVFGSLAGAVNGLERACGGVVEILLSPFPPYGPVMEPPLPTYLCPAPRSPEDLVKRIGAKALRDDANATCARALKAGFAEDPRDVPSEYWGEAIRQLKPLRVYLHGANLVVVLRADGGAEEGLYFMPRISSSIPRSGQDGFVFTEIDDDIYKFTRKTGSG